VVERENLVGHLAAPCCRWIDGDGGQQQIVGLVTYIPFREIEVPFSDSGSSSVGPEHHLSRPSFAGNVFCFVKGLWPGLGPPTPASPEKHVAPVPNGLNDVEASTVRNYRTRHTPKNPRRLQFQGYPSNASTSSSQARGSRSPRPASGHLWVLLTTPRSGPSREPTCGIAAEVESLKTLDTAALGPAPKALAFRSFAQDDEESKPEAGRPSFLFEL
jgi:hypothetical protein